MISASVLLSFLTFFLSSLSKTQRKLFDSQEKIQRRLDCLPLPFLLCLLPLCLLLLFFLWEKSQSGLHQWSISGQEAISPYETPSLTLPGDRFLWAIKSLLLQAPLKEKYPAKFEVFVCRDGGRRSLVWFKGLWKLQDEVKNTQIFKAREFFQLPAKSCPFHREQQLSHIFSPEIKTKEIKAIRTRSTLCLLLHACEQCLQKYWYQTKHLQENGISSCTSNIVFRT